MWGLKKGSVYLIDHALRLSLSLSVSPSLSDVSLSPARSLSLLLRTHPRERFWRARDELICPWSVGFFEKALLFPSLSILPSKLGKILRRLSVRGDPWVNLCEIFWLHGNPGLTDAPLHRLFHREGGLDARWSEDDAVIEMFVVYPAGS